MSAMEGVQMTGPGPDPGKTVYVHRLPERVPIPRLVGILKALFDGYGNIVDIVAKKSLKRKGQAFVVFDNVDSATRAVDDIDGFEIAGRPIHCTFSRTQSDATVERDGTAHELEQHKRHRLAMKEKKQAEEAALKPVVPAGEPDKRARAKAAQAVIPDEYLQPNNILFLQNLPSDVNVGDLTKIFEIYEGFKEIRTVPSRPEIAFVEYETIDAAIVAKSNTSGIPVGAEGKPMKVTFQRQ